MIDLRLYRVALLPSLAAAIVAMFSLVSRPEPLGTELVPGVFDAAAAASLERQLLELAPERPPGSAGDAAAARFVGERFRRVVGGEVSLQSFSGSFEGDEVDMRNVVLVLPGVSSRRVVVVAPRDCPEGRCAASSAAATASLLELANSFNAASHRKTLIFVSTDGSSDGAEGARALVELLAEEPLEGVIVISQPGSAREAPPFVISSSSGPQSTSDQLFRSARLAVAAEVGRTVEEQATLGSLLRLAVPTGIGEQAALIEEGLDAIAISSAGELPLEPEADARFSEAALDEYGRATLSLIQVLDDADRPLVHGPEAYVPLGGKLIPGWALSLLALALLLPIGLVSIDGLARASRAGRPVLAALGWVLRGALPFACGVVLTYLLAVVGPLQRPAFPYDPARFPFGFGAAATLFVLAAAIGGVLWLLRPLAPHGRLREALAPATGMVLFVAAVGMWAVNPYLALLFVPTVHLWLFAAMPDLGGGTRFRAALGVLGLLAPLVIVVHVASRLGVGVGVPWQLVLMLTGGHIGLGQALFVCLLAGCALGLGAAIATAGRGGYREARKGSRRDKELAEYATFATK